MVTPSAKRLAVGWLTTEHRLSVTLPCRAVRLSRTAFYEPPSPSAVSDQLVIDALQAMVAGTPRGGFWKCYDRLRLLGHRWNHKRVHRVCCARPLNLPRRTHRRPPARVVHPLAAPTTLNETWALDSMTDTLEDLISLHGAPRSLRVDNGPELTSIALTRWCAQHQIVLHYIRPGKPQQNAYIERFNGSYRTEYWTRTCSRRCRTSANLPPPGW